VATKLNGKQPDWRIYSIGGTTKQLVKKYLGEETIAGNANSAAELAELITADEEIEKVIFFCGDRRRDELTDILRRHHIEVNEIMVYKTVNVSHKVEKKYHGILFFSPSTVESFFNNNTTPGSSVFFAIGNTTANEIKKYSNNKIIISQ